MDLGFNVQCKIQRSLEEVFDGVYDPKKLSGYFTTGGANAPLVEGTTVYWAFADNPGDEEAKFPVKVKEVVQNEKIVLGWEGAVGLETVVEMNFTAAGPEDTIIQISETGWRETQNDLKSSYLNCMGWTQMACCLKAYLEHGINLRQGAFSGLYKASDNKGGASS